MDNLTERQALLRKLDGAQFAAWEIRIYLDTHPDDAEAMAAFQKYNEKFEQYRQEYESRYGAVSATRSVGANRFEWINSPWPWEMEGN